MDGSTTLRAIGASNRLIRRVARRLDNFLDAHNLFAPSIRRMLQDVYKAKLFTKPVLPQPSSRLLSLPAEIRCMIYAHLFESDDSDYLRPPQLALLATCRLIHGEAYRFALSTLVFHMTVWDKKLHLRKSLSALGPLQTHLRRVRILITLPELQSVGANNPFTLVQLPLEELEIQILKTVTESWASDVNFFHLIVSAICHVDQAEDKDGNPKGPHRSIHESFRKKNMRRIEQKYWNYTPSQKDLYHMLDSMQAKKVVVRTVTDVLFRAFLYFGMVSLNLSKMVMKAPNGGRYLAFYNGLEEPRGYLEFGKLEE